VREIEGGWFWISGKRAGGFGQKALLLPPSPATQNAGDRRPTVEGGRGAGDLVHDDGRELGRNEEEVEGNRFRFLPRVGVLRRGGSTAGSGAVRGGDRSGTGGGDGGLRKEGELVVEVRGEVGSRSGPFIGAGRSVRRGYFELRGAPMVGNGGWGKIPAWTPASGILGRLAAV
jgi:hypothetical protein